MYHALVMRGSESRTKLLRDLDPLVTRQPANPPQQPLEVLTVDVFHGQKVLGIHLADVVHPADVGMADLPRQSDFAVKVFQSLRVLSEILRQKLQRNRVPELQIVGAVDFAHPTFPTSETIRYRSATFVPGRNRP